MSKIKLLLVDDEEDYVKTMAERMEMRDVGSRVALSGEEALQMVEEDTPDVMVLDLRMPGINGMEVLERVKQEHPHVQVIILTGHGAEKEEEEARRLGAFEYLQMPADTSQLLTTVRSAWTKGISFLKDSRDGFERTMTAAALAEGGLPEMARQEGRAPVPSQANASAEAKPAQVSTSGQGLKVLFVDDEEDFVLSGQQALQMLEDDVPDVMVLDLRMPGIDGMEVLRRVKKTFPEIEVIIMTGHGSDQDEEEARRLGAFDYLRKPVDIDHLMETVRNAGRARKRAE
jgi:DNA-binding NtrC family response regulator